MDIRAQALSMGFDAAEPLSIETFPQAKAFLPSAQTLWVLVTAHQPFRDEDWPKDALIVASHYPASQVAYHRTNTLAQMLQQQGIEAVAHPFLPAKKAALMAGLGWMGKQELLHHPQFGTYVCLHLLLISQKEDIPPITPLSSPCQSCRICVDACPTGAVVGDGTIRPEQCIRSYMLEGRTFPDAMLPSLGNRLVGCEVCQQVCPYNASVGHAAIPPQLVEAAQLRHTNEKDFSQRIQILSQLLGKNLIRPQRVKDACSLCERSICIQNQSPLEEGHYE